MKINYIVCLAVVTALSWPKPYNFHQNAKVTLQAIETDTTYNTSNLFAPGTQPVLVSRQFKFTEGPAADRHGNVYFTDQPNNAIWKYGTDGKLTLITHHAGRANGLYIDKHGNLLACADEQNQLWRFTPQGVKTAILLTDINGHKFNGPNDLCVDTKGGIYFTDPYYQRPYWTRTQTDLDGEKVYYLPAGKIQPVIVATDLQKPNGIALTPDGKNLYVSDIKADKTYKYTIDKDGGLTNRQLFTAKGSDGMTLDDNGNVYLTGNKGVSIYNNKGEKAGLITINEPWTANVCFAGKKRNILFITASTAIYTFQMNVSGANKNASTQH